MSAEVKAALEAAQRLGLSPAAVSAMEQGRSDPAELAAAEAAAERSAHVSSGVSFERIKV